MEVGRLSPSNCIGRRTKAETTHYRVRSPCSRLLAFPTCASRTQSPLLSLLPHGLTTSGDHAVDVSPDRQPAGQHALLKHARMRQQRLAEARVNDMAALVGGDYARCSHISFMQLRKYIVLTGDQQQGMIV